MAEEQRMLKPSLVIESRNVENPEYRMPDVQDISESFFKANFVKAKEAATQLGISNYSYFLSNILRGTEKSPNTVAGLFLRGRRKMWYVYLPSLGNHQEVVASNDLRRVIGHLSEADLPVVQQFIIDKVKAGEFHSDSDLDLATEVEGSTSGSKKQEVSLFA